MDTVNEHELWILSDIMLRVAKICSYLFHSFDSTLEI